MNLQGNEATLGSFTQDFSTLTKVAASKKNKSSTPSSPCTTDTPTAETQVHNIAQFSPLLGYDNQNPDHQTVNQLRERLALFEVELTELREHVCSYTRTTPDLQEQLCHAKHQLETATQDLREQVASLKRDKQALTTEVRETKDIMRKEIAQMKEEMARELSAIVVELKP